jgi:hypothetical protein
MLPLESLQQNLNVSLDKKSFQLSVVRLSKILTKRR